MSLNGTFKTTRFSDLVEFYAVSKESGVVRIKLGDKEQADGVFLFSKGDLIGAKLEGKYGQQAIERALQLTDGSFASRDEPLDLEPLEPESLDAGQAALPFVSPMEQAAQDPAREPAPSVEADWDADASAPTPGAEEDGGAAALACAEAAAPPPDLVAPDVPATAGATPAGERSATRSRHLMAAGSMGIGVALLAVLAVAFGGRAPKTAAPRAAAAPAAATSSAGNVRGVLDDTIILGMVSAFTGSNKERARSMRAGWEVAIAEANEKGGVHGRKLRLVVQDDGYDPARTLPGMKAVVEEQQAFAVVGNLGTATAAVAAPYAESQKTILFGALASGDVLRKQPPDRHVFNFRPGAAQEAEAAVRYLVEVRRIDPARIALLSQDDGFGASGRNGALKRLAAYGRAAEDVLQLTYPRNTTDVRDAIARLRARARDFDAVVMVATYRPGATFVRKAKDAGLKLFVTNVSADSSELAEELVAAGARYTSDVLLTQVTPVPTSHATTLVRYRETLARYAPDEKPGSTSLEGWLGAQVFLEALRRAGRDLDTSRLVSTLEGIRDWDMGIGCNITFGPADHQACDVVWGWMLQPDGSYRQIELE